MSDGNGIVSSIGLGDGRGVDSGWRFGGGRRVEGSGGVNSLAENGVGVDVTVKFGTAVMVGAALGVRGVVDVR